MIPDINVSQVERVIKIKSHIFEFKRVKTQPTAAHMPLIDILKKTKQKRKQAGPTCHNLKCINEPHGLFLIENSHIPPPSRSITNTWWETFTPSQGLSSCVPALIRTEQHVNMHGSKQAGWHTHTHAQRPINSSHVEIVLNFCYFSTQICSGLS